MYTLSPSKSIKGSNYGEFLKDKNVLLMYMTVLSAYKYAPNLESLLTQQYVCVKCTLSSNNPCIFTRFYSVKNANTQLIWSSVTLFLLRDILLSLSLVNTRKITNLPRFADIYSSDGIRYFYLRVRGVPNIHSV